MIYRVFYQYMDGPEASELIYADTGEEAGAIMLQYIERDEGEEVQHYKITAIIENSVT